MPSVLSLDPFLHAYPRWAARAGRRADLQTLLDGVYTDHALGRLVPGAEADARAAGIHRHCGPDGRFHARGSFHFWEHTTAYATSALALLGRTAPRRLADLDRLAAPGALHAWLESCGWDAFWVGSHQVGGVAAVAHLQGAGAAWLDPWFAALEAWVDPRTGLWTRGLVHRLGWKGPGVHELAGAAHLWWVYAHRGRALPHPERIVDTALRLQRPSGLWGRGAPFCRELDGVWALTTASDQAGGYRGDEVRRACRRTLAAVVAALNDLEARYRAPHKLAGALQAAAWIQRRYPRELATPTPLRPALEAVPWM